MGLLLSVLVSCVGVVEAIACVKRITYGALPTEQSDLHKVTQKYDELFAKAAKQNNYKIEDFDMCGRGYLEINGGGSKGPIKATIKYFGKDQDSIPILFSTKISSFGQESVESDIANKRTPSKSPDRNTTVKTQIPQEQSFYINKSSSSRENLSDESPFQSMESPEPKEKIKWHYRPLSPSGGEKSLPEIHFDSYERNSFQSDQSSFSEDFLR